MRTESCTSCKPVAFTATINQMFKGPASKSITKAELELSKLHNDLVFHIKDNSCGGVSIVAKLKDIIIGSFHNGSSRDFNVQKFMTQWGSKMQVHAEKAEQKSLIAMA